MKYDKILTKEFLEKEYIQNKRSPYDIAREIGSNPHVIYNALKRLNIEQQDRTGKIQSGQKFNKLTTVKVVDISKNRTFIWECVCDCGNISNVRTSQLKNQSIKSCGCIAKGDSNKRWTGCGEVSGNFYTGIRCCAKNRKIDFNISVEDIWNTYLKQDKKCYLSGLDINFKMYNETASVDRIDSSLGYKINNIGICHKDINKIKASFSVSDFIEYCKLISTFNGVFTPIECNFNLHSTYYKDLIHNAKRRNKEFDITIEDIGIIFKKQGGACALTGLKLTFPTNTKEYRSRVHNFSVDRIDNNIGYYVENIQIVHKLINQSRKNLEIGYYKELCQKVMQYKS